MQFYSTEEFAKLAGVSIRTLKYWRKSGKLSPAKTQGGAKFYSQAQLEGVQNSGLRYSRGAKFSITELVEVTISAGKLFKGIKLSTGREVQIYPSNQFVIVSDKMTNKIFNANRKNSADIDIVEDSKSDTLTELNLTLSNEFPKNNLTAFDHIIFDACISEQEKGNQFTTLAIIYRAIGGGEDNKITPASLQRIFDSVKKLATTWVSFDCSAICQKFGYNNGKAYAYNGYLLPLEFVIATVNGQIDTVAVHFLRNSPLLDVAKMKGQVITCNSKLLRLPKLNNTERVLSIKGYLFRRILQIIGSHKPHKAHLAGKSNDNQPIYRRNKKLEKSILLDSLYAQCEIDTTSKLQQQRARETITKVMEHFKANNLISEWHFTKKDRKFYSISFNFK